MFEDLFKRFKESEETKANKGTKNKRSEFTDQNYGHGSHPKNCNFEKKRQNEI